MLGQAVSVLGHLLAMLLCLAGLALSCVSLSGTWLVTAAAAVAWLVREDPFPGVWTVLLFAVLSAAVEGLEAVAGYWGVRRRGGSAGAGLAAAVGGVAGLALGSLVPVPVLGSLAGMSIVSFALVYWVERRRLRRSDTAARVAWGAVLSRVGVLLLKVLVTLGMAVVLAVGMLA